jgi:hypothetical protein
VDRPDDYFPPPKGVPARVPPTRITPVHGPVSADGTGEAGSRGDSRRRLRLGEALVQAGLVTQPQLEQLLAEQTRTPPAARLRLGALVAHRGLASEEDISQGLSRILTLGYVNPLDDPPDPAAARLIPREIAEELLCLPLRAGASWVQVAVADPTDHVVPTRVRELSGRASVTLVVAPATALREATARAWDAAVTTAPQRADVDLRPQPGPNETTDVPLVRTPPAEAATHPAGEWPSGWSYVFVGDALPYDHPLFTEAARLEAKLTDLGAQGWEAVGMIADGPRLRVLMKRPRS